MEKLDKVIAGLTGCIVCNCSNCEYGGNGCRREELMKDALECLRKVDLVFCEECKYSRRTGRAGYLFCNNPLGIGRGVVSTDFCSEGERRNDG